MILKSGTRPIAAPPKKLYHERFVCGTGPVADFNVDAGIQMQNQEADQAPTECTGYYYTDARGDADKVIYTPDFNYAATIYVEGEDPNTGGADPLAAGQAGVLRGFVPKASANISALQNGELFVANFGNWQPFLKTLAMKVVNCDVHNALGNGNAYESILNAALASRIGVGIVTPWYKEWQQNGPSDGLLPMPQDPSALETPDGALPWHMHAIKGQKTENGVPYALDKSWQGAGIGDGGWLKLSAEVLNAVLEVPGTCALIPIMTGPRFVPIASMMLQHKQLIIPEFSQLFNTAPGTPALV